jgi:hypothetical protein
MFIARRVEKDDALGVDAIIQRIGRILYRVSWCCTGAQSFVSVDRTVEARDIVDAGNSPVEAVRARQSEIA